jgi:NAD(P)-dependent dehydrogenase (short-subunit alcohol dehydrogenase family)
MIFSLENKIAIVTGGCSGIGKAISELFAQQGAIVYQLDITNETKTSQNLIFQKCDVSNQSEVKNVIAEIANKHAGINILVNNAGISHIGTVETTTEEDFERLLKVNVKGVYNCIWAIVPYMKEKGGVILNLASIASLVGLPERFAYSMTKGAVAGMTLSVAKDYLHYNIRCNSISPARVHTPFVDNYLRKTYPGKEKEMFDQLSQTQPIGRMATAEEVASLALYLCSDEASFITGNDYPIDGGFVKLNN